MNKKKLDFNLFSAHHQLLVYQAKLIQDMMMSTHVPPIIITASQKSSESPTFKIIKNRERVLENPRSEWGKRIKAKIDERHKMVFDKDSLDFFEADCFFPSFQGKSRIHKDSSIVVPPYEPSNATFTALDYHKAYAAKHIQTDSY